MYQSADRTISYFSKNNGKCEVIYNIDLIMLAICVTTVIFNASKSKKWKNAK